MERIQLNFMKQLQHILKKFVRSIKVKNLYYELKTNKEYILLLIFFLKFHFSTQIENLIDIIVIDRPNKKKRFTLIYNLLSLNYNVRFLVKVKINEISKLMSLTPIYSTANWYEREVWDMFGIYFTNHPDLRRILTDYNFQGYPLRKDFPLSGFIELFYSSVNTKLVYKKVKLSQAYRIFKFNYNNTKNINMLKTIKN